MTTLADDISLVESLRFAVPLLITELLSRPSGERDRTARRWASAAVSVIGGSGESLLGFIVKDRRRVARAFQSLAEGLAAAAVLTPGGVTAAGLHWCVETACARCRPPRTAPPVSRAELDARLEELDADFRRVAGLPALAGSEVAA